VAFGGYGGSATGGGIYVFGGTLEVRQSTITQNSAYGGLGGQGYINSGLPGVGQGGGLYIAPATPPRADLDTDTVSNTINNFANIDPNISGPYTSNGGTFNPTLSISDVSTPEGNTGTHAITFTVSLSAASNQPITVAYATANGTAAAGSDYQAASGTLTFAPGETTKTITVAVLGDLVYEPNETFAVNLSGATNATIADGNGLGTIVNDDTYVTPSISIGDVSKAEGRNGNTMFTFTVTLSAPSTTTVTVNYSTANGMATALEDYTAASGTLTFAPGETTKTITIKVKGDRKREADETFFVNLFGASSNATILDTQGIGTILNDD
jgi:hypothetical protein